MKITLTLPYSVNVEQDQRAKTKETVILVTGENLPVFCCTLCGKCCNDSLSVPITFKEAQTIENYLSSCYLTGDKPQPENIDGYYTLLPQNPEGQCIFLIKRRKLFSWFGKQHYCKIYKKRPYSCRLFPYKFSLSEANIILLGVHKIAEFICEGLNKTKKVSFETSLVLQGEDIVQQDSILRKEILNIVKERLFR